MKLKDIMTEDVETIRPEQTIREAAQKMADLDIGSVPVTDDEIVVGVVTDRDITIKATALGLNPDSVPVRDVMTSPIIYCYEDSEVEHAAEIMESNQIRRLPVLNRHQKLVGIISLSDLAIKSRPSIAARTLEGISERFGTSLH